VPLKRVKPQPATMKMSVLTVSGPVASMKLSSLSVAVPVSIPNIPDSILNTVSKWIPICSSDYTNNDHN